MIAEKMKPFVQNNSAIRMMFEEGNRLRAKYGANKVYDFSLGNPSVPAPDCVREAIINLVNNEEPTVLHGYMSNAGFEDVRETIAQSLNRRFGTAFSAHNLIMTVGAASGLNVILKTILNPGEEVIVFAPYFLEYGAYVRNYDGKLVEISPNTETFQPNLKELEEKITANTRAVIVNTPHNPTGVVYSEETIKELAAILEKKQQEFGSVIYLISDEPYREIVFDGKQQPYVSKFYANTISCYSFSKALSLPGERIGYLAVNPACPYAAEIVNMCGQISRGIGHNCPTSLMQLAVSKVLDLTSDFSVYEKNRNLLYECLTDCGFEVVKPEGTFYIFPKAPEADAAAFCQKALQYDLVLVPADSFGCPGYFRMAYCIDTEKVERSLPVLRKMMKEIYG